MGEKKKTSWLAWAALALVLYVVFRFATAPDEPSKPAAPALTAEQKAEADRKEALFQAGLSRARQAVAAMKAGSREPERFKLESAFLIEGTSVVCFEFRTANVMGGISPGKAVYTGAGKLVTSDDPAPFGKAWNSECAGKPGRELRSVL